MEINEPYIIPPGKAVSKIAQPSLLLHPFPSNYLQSTAYNRQYHRRALTQTLQQCLHENAMIHVYSARANKKKLLCM